MQVKSVETSTCLKFSRVALQRNIEKRTMSTLHEERMEQHGEGKNQCHVAFRIISRKNAQNMRASGYKKVAPQ